MANRKITLKWLGNVEAYCSWKASTLTLTGDNKIVVVALESPYDVRAMRAALDKIEASWKRTLGV